MFEREIWVAFEAKSESDPEGQISADVARQSGGHINYTANSTGAPAPAGSFAVIVTPQERIDRAAAAVADDRVYLAQPALIRDIADRLTSAWDSIRIRTRGLNAAAAEPVNAQILREKRLLPSQWLPGLTARRLADG